MATPSSALRVCPFCYSVLVSHVDVSPRSIERTCGACGKKWHEEKPLPKMSSAATEK